VLNRLGYGPRPGDVEKVRRIGLSNYIEQQLHPERIDDSALEARLDRLETLDMSTQEIAREYFLPALMERWQQKREQADNPPPDPNAAEVPGGPGAAAARDGEQVLDLLAVHPSTSKFICTKLARRFVGDDPPASLVDRAAATFRETDGNLREVVRTIITSTEFFSADAYRAKVKTPLEFVVSALRASSAQIENGMGLVRSLQQLGMPLYFSQPPTGYADTADAWVNTGGLVNRMNFAISLVENRVPGVRVDIASITGVGPNGSFSARSSRA
jgi:hypothetical protein